MCLQMKRTWKRQIYYNLAAFRVSSRVKKFRFLFEVKSLMQDNYVDSKNFFLYSSLFSFISFRINRYAASGGFHVIDKCFPYRWLALVILISCYAWTFWDFSELAHLYRLLVWTTRFENWNLFSWDGVKSKTTGSSLWWMSSWVT